MDNQQERPIRARASSVSSVPAETPANITPQFRPRGRARSGSINLESSPFEVPLTADEQSLTRLIQQINEREKLDQELSKQLSSLPETDQSEKVDEELAKQLSLFLEKDQPSASPDYDDFSYEAYKSPLYEERLADEGFPAYEETPPNLGFPSYEDFPAKQREETESERRSEVLDDKVKAKQAATSHKLERSKGRDIRNNMNYQNYLDSPSAGPSGNPRQAPPSPSQNMNHANGMNGGAMGLGGMVGFPTPAGHQSDLNYIMTMVEELSRQLEHNQRLTSSVVDKIGKVRERAANMDLTNDELIAMVSNELNEDTKNLEKECAELRKKLEKCEHDKDENWNLAIHGCNILSDILEKVHKYKEQHEIDTLAWHKNYRKQLSDEREENLALRNQINDMRAAACRANEWLRKLRRALTDNDELNELRIQVVQYRLERRFWKRMAMPMIPDDDSEWSDDDDIIDPEEKKRQAAEKAEKERKENEGDDDQGQTT